MTEEELDEAIDGSPVPTEIEVTSAHGQDMGADIVDKIFELFVKLEKLVKGTMNGGIIVNCMDFYLEFC